MADMDLLSRRLLEIEGPLYAVLDGAQFDDLPASLLDGDFEHRPLYHSDTIGDADRSRTAPQLIWLDRDRTRESAVERADPAILKRLLRLVGTRPAVVFWHFHLGGDALFRHLRTLNMVRLPNEALSPDEQKWSSETTVACIFRHADANVMAQVLSGLDPVEMARLFGPADSILFAPDGYWSKSGRAIEAKRPANLPKAPTGMLELSIETMARIADARSQGLRRWAQIEFTSEGSARTADERSLQIDRAFARAKHYELEQKDEIWEFIRLDLAHGPGFEDNPRYPLARYYLSSSTKSAKERIYYASQHCDAATGAQ